MSHETQTPSCAAAKGKHNMRTVLITGANRGIGLEHARRFIAAGVDVIAAVREPNEAQDLASLSGGGSGRLEVLPYDAANDAAAGALKDALGNRAIDLLFCNAGVPDRHGLGAIEAETFMRVMRINTLAPLELAQALVENVAASERRVIAMQSSLMGSISDNNAGGAYAYRCSKTALNMATKSLSCDLRKRGVTVVTLHPGWVKTRMGGTAAPVSVEDCVSGQQKLFATFSAEHSGRFFNYDGVEIPW
jgi:NAD(P)-dependent dehydrogenase (short-subunit alcohol dehydrogenase family)